MAENTVDFLCLPPLFFACPDAPLYFITQKALMFGPMSDGVPFTKSLLTVARRYEVPLDDELTSQVARKVGAGNGNDVLHVGPVWVYSINGGRLSVSSVPQHLQLTSKVSRLPWYLRANSYHVNRDSYYTELVTMK
jgi:hypothetical protein